MPEKVSRRNVLIFPAGTEIGLEIFHALHYCKDVRLHGAGQDVSNHGRFLYPEYHILPSIHERHWLEHLRLLCKRLAIEYIFPAYDDVLMALVRERTSIPATILTSPELACEITRSKSATYRRLAGIVNVPVVHGDPACVDEFPVLVKPDRGQGSFGVRTACNRDELLQAVKAVPDAIICEYLPGDEYTVDCFSDRERGLLFAGARERCRIRNGISVNTVIKDLPEAREMAEAIGGELKLHGAWFFQIKRSATGVLTLLEVAPRIAGAMAAHRIMGVNFPLLSIYEHERLPIRVMPNSGDLELDRALGNRYSHSFRFGVMYVDLDDTLLFNGKVNTRVIKLIFQCINKRKPVKLITRHRGDVRELLLAYRLDGLFDRVIEVKEDERKADYIKEADAILVDDSFSERMDVAEKCRIATFDCSMIDVLTEQAELLNEDDNECK